MVEIEFKKEVFYKHPKYKKYMASKCGKILSLKRKEKKILKLQNNGWGYYQFGLYENNTKKYYRVSRFNLFLSVLRERFQLIKK